jgi:hypothetical protein
MEVGKLDSKEIKRRIWYPVLGMDGGSHKLPERPEAQEPSRLP